MEAPDRQRVGVALFLSVALAVAAGFMDFGAPAFEQREQVTLYGFEDAVESEEGLARSVSHGAPFVVPRACSVEVEVTRERAAGWSGILVGVVPQGESDADVRDVPVELFAGEQVAQAHLSALAPGTYRLRIEGATAGPAEADHVLVRVTGGRRTAWPLLLAGLLVWAPALLPFTRRGRRSSGPGPASGSVPCSLES